MKLRINELLNYEIIHHYDGNLGDEIKSTGNNFYIKVKGKAFEFSIPGQNKFLMKYRMFRRFRQS